MTPAWVSQRVVTNRLDIVDQMLTTIRSLPLDTLDSFLGDERNVWTAESCLRRSLEALMDIGRHILAKSYGDGVTEYKEIVAGLREHGVLNQAEGGQMFKMAGYRNRLVHLYHAVGPEELYEICIQNLGDIELIQNAYLRWLAENPDKVDRRL